jgi:hypothetical protein
VCQRIAWDSEMEVEVSECRGAAVKQICIVPRLAVLAAWSRSRAGYPPHWSSEASGSEPSGSAPAGRGAGDRWDARLAGFAAGGRMVSRLSSA